MLAGDTPVSRSNPSLSLMVGDRGSFNNHIHTCGTWQAWWWCWKTKGLRPPQPLMRMCDQSARAGGGVRFRILERSQVVETSLEGIVLTPREWERSVLSWRPQHCSYISGCLRLSHVPKSRQGMGVRGRGGWIRDLIRVYYRTDGKEGAM